MRPAEINFSSPGTLTVDFLCSIPHWLPFLLLITYCFFILRKQKLREVDGFAGFSWLAMRYQFSSVVFNPLWPHGLQHTRPSCLTVLPRERTGHSKHPLPTTQEKILHMDITRWSIPKSDWLYALQKMEKIYTVSKNKTRSWLWLRSWTPYCKEQRRHFAKKGPHSQSYVLLFGFYPVVLHGCENWTISKADSWRIDVFKLWYWWRPLRVAWTTKRSNQGINPKYSLEGLMLKLQ